jgi:tetratricopeptide (TPR) repeat protein
VNTRRDIPRCLVLPPLLCAVLLACVPSWSQSPPAAGPPAQGDSYAEFRKLLDAKQYDQAIEQARKLVEEASRHPDAGEELQVSVMNLAVAQYLAGDYVGAEASYLRVIELVEASGRPTSPRLARAEAGLATTYYAGKRYDLAVQRFDRAVALSRRSEGLFNEAQLPLLEKYADSLTEVNRLQDALKVRRYALKVVERRYGADSLRYAQELESIGRWYARVRAYDASRASLRRAIDIVETSKGENAVELIGPLTGLAECDRRQLLDPTLQQVDSADAQRAAMFHDPMSPMGPVLSSSTLTSEGQKALERAVAIASGRPDAAPVQVADVRTQLGDWYQSRLQSDRALPNYEQAWQAATGQTIGGKPLTDVLFGRPVLLHYLPPDSWDRYYGRPAGEATVKNTQVEFTVTAQGRVVDPKVIADGGEPKLGAQTVRAVQTARYRPRFDKGRPVDTPGVRLDQVFYVLVESTPPTEPTPRTEAPKPGT